MHGLGTDFDHRYKFFRVFDSNLDGRVTSSEWNNVFIFYGDKDDEKRLTASNMDFFFENNAINLCLSDH